MSGTIPSERISGLISNDTIKRASNDCPLNSSTMRGMRVIDKFGGSLLSFVPDKPPDMFFPRNLDTFYFSSSLPPPLSLSLVRFSMNGLYLHMIELLLISALCGSMGSLWYAELSPTHKFYVTFCFVFFAFHKVAYVL